MISIKDKKVIDAIINGRKIKAIYTMGYLVWPKDYQIIDGDDEILSCYYNGYWIDEYPWTDDTPWTD